MYVGGSVMDLQYIAARPRRGRRSDALASHSRRLAQPQYHSLRLSNNNVLRNTHVYLTSESGCVRHFVVPCPTNSNRRLRCLRASNCLQCSASLPPSQHAQADRPKKNTLLLTQSLSRLSQHTQASTSNCLQGQAFAPVLTNRQSAPDVRGVTC